MEIRVAKNSEYFFGWSLIDCKFNGTSLELSLSLESNLNDVITMFWIDDFSSSKFKLKLFFSLLSWQSTWIFSTKRRQTKERRLINILKNIFDMKNQIYGFGLSWCHYDFFFAMFIWTTTLKYLKKKNSFCLKLIKDGTRHEIWVTRDLSAEKFFLCFLFFTTRRLLR